MNENVDRQSDSLGRFEAAGTILDEDECWSLLSQARFGRLAMAVAADIDVFPVNFVVDGQDLVFRTAEGTKLLESVIADLVAVEADDRNPATGVAWSVVAKGTAQVLERFESIYQAQQLDIRPWGRGARERFVRITVTSITGRRFHAAGADSEG